MILIHLCLPRLRSLEYTFAIPVSVEIVYTEISEVNFQIDYYYSKIKKIKKMSSRYRHPITTDSYRYHLID